MKKRIYYLLTVLLLGTISVLAQTQKVKGVVNDSKGEPLPGASVVIKGTLQGVVTGIAGDYLIDVKNPDISILVFSYVGMITKEEAVKSRNIINVSMDASAVTLDDYVVVAYSTQKKIAVTGAISSIQTKDLKQSSSANLSNALAGRLSGLTSVQTSGQPGNDNATLYLRGAGTLNGKGPLILIDGVPRDDISSVDPNEVGSISILKDASATAVFGVRGANGVILITTRRGNKNQKPELSINVQTSLQSYTRKPEHLSSLDYMQLFTEAELNDPNTPIIIVGGQSQKKITYTPDFISKFTNPNKTEMDAYLYPDHDYYKESLYEYTPQTKVNLNMSGGTEKTQYFVNTSYLHQGGQFKTESESVLGYDPSFKLDRFNFRANVDYKITNNLNAFVNLASYLDIVGSPNAQIGADENASSIVANILYHLTSMRPIDIGPVTIPGLMWGTTPVDVGYPIIPPSSSDAAPYELVNNVGYAKQNRLNFNGSFGLNLNLDFITKGLSAKGMASYDTRASSTLSGSQLLKNYAYSYVGDSVIFTNGSRSSNQYMYFSKYTVNRYNINAQFTLNYERVFGQKHKVGAMILAQRDNWVVQYGSNTDLLPYNVVSFAGRINYAFDDRYLAEFDAGYNGSEQFAPDKRFGFFPSVSVGWVLTNEPFMKALVSKAVLNSLKFRFSYGTAGNDQLGNYRFLYLTDMNYTLNDRNFQTSGLNSVSYDPGYMPSLANSNVIKIGKLGNPDIQWELSKKQNLGIDIELFRDLKISFDYYKEHRSDILVTRNTMPLVLGIIENPKANVGIVDNHGFETEVIYIKPITSDLSVSFRGNIGFNDNKVVEADEVIKPEGYVDRYRQTGYRINQPFGYLIDNSNGNGYFNTQDEIDNFKTPEGKNIKYSFGNYGLGDFKYKDLNGDGIINEMDMVPIGYSSSVPGITFGISAGINYKAIDFTILFQGLGRYSTVYSGANVYETQGKGSYLDYHKNAWTAERYSNGDKITYPALHVSAPNVNQQPNEFFIMNRSFIRLKNIEIGYTIPKRTSLKAGIKNCRLYLSGQNLFTWDQLRTKSFDPELSSPISYPVMKMVTMGANLNF